MSTPLLRKGCAQMWENVINCTALIIWLFRVSYFTNSSSQILKLIISYFGLIISQIRVRKCVILRMPINNADIPIADNEPEVKIDNPVERIYLYRVASTSFPIIIRSGLRFYKYKQKFNGLDTFISEDGAYYISAYGLSGTSGYWIIAPTIGQGGSAGNRLNTTFNSSFFPRGTPVEGQYSSIAVTISLAKITSDTR
jgi:hypothetical protein